MALTDFLAADNSYSEVRLVRVPGQIILPS